MEMKIERIEMLFLEEWNVQILICYRHLSSQVSSHGEFRGWKYLLQSVPRISTLKIGALKFTGSWKRISQTQFHLIAV